jgi:hypothetical protein
MAGHIQTDRLTHKDSPMYSKINPGDQYNLDVECIYFIVSEMLMYKQLSPLICVTSMAIVVEPVADTIDPRKNLYSS